MSLNHYINSKLNFFKMMRLPDLAAYRKSPSHNSRRSYAHRNTAVLRPAHQPRPKPHYWARYTPRGWSGDQLRGWAWIVSDTRRQRSSVRFSRWGARCKHRLDQCERKRDRGNEARMMKGTSGWFIVLVRTTAGKMRIQISLSAQHNQT